MHCTRRGGNLVASFLSFSAAKISHWSKTTKESCQGFLLWPFLVFRGVGLGGLCGAGSWGGLGRYLGQYRATAKVAWG